jgi:hypothetical protein
MISLRSVEIKLFKSTWFHIGYSLRRFAVGFSIDRWGFNLDIGPIWISIEF